MFGLLLPMMLHNNSSEFKRSIDVFLDASDIWCEENCRLIVQNVNLDSLRNFRLKSKCVLLRPTERPSSIDHFPFHAIYEPILKIVHDAITSDATTDQFPSLFTCIYRSASGYISLQRESNLTFYWMGCYFCMRSHFTPRIPITSYALILCASLCVQFLNHWERARSLYLALCGSWIA